MLPYASELQKEIEGEVKSDLMSKQIYSVDASIFEIAPDLVVLPKTKRDIQKTIVFASRHRLPVIARGAGTGIAGGCIGKGIIIDTSKYLSRILHIDGEKRYALCEPGVIQDQLNEAASPFGLCLGPETSTGNRATLGGMAAANAAGAHFLHYGNMASNVESVEIALSDGSLVTLGEIDETTFREKETLNSLEGAIYRKLRALGDRYREEVARHFPKMKRRSSGYNLDALYESPLNLAKLIVGSEGTLGVITEIKLKLVPHLKDVGLILLPYKSLIESLASVPFILTHSPVALEMIDARILEMGRLSPKFRNRIDWLPRDIEALLIVGFSSKKALDSLIDHFPTAISIEDAERQKTLWALRKAGLGLLLSRRSYSRAIAFLEDIALPPENAAPFVAEMISFLEKQGVESGIYGHAGDACLHIRPYLDLRKAEELLLMKQLMKSIASLVLKYEGVLSGEHGDGVIRGWLTSEMFGEKLYQGFCDLKSIFDPENLLNPGKKIGDLPPDRDLRMHPKIQQAPFTPFLNFEKEGGFALAVDLCNGNGECRKKTKLMCPSFHATGDERDTTRARAQGLRAIINGKIPFQELTGEGLHDILDYCLECKGCKTECPSQVDMAKMKAEVLYHYQKKHGIPLRSRLFGNIGSLARLGCATSSFSNWFINSSWGKQFLSSLGIAPERPLPRFAKRRFSQWWLNRVKAKSSQKVVLFNDTFNEFYAPEIGQAAVKLLEALNFEVMVLPWHCCGRPLISKGMLPQARKKAEKLTSLLTPYARENVPIIGLEPSCLFTMSDDYADLIENSSVGIIKKSCHTLDEFLIKQLPFPFPFDVRNLHFHGHCHQKTLIGNAPTLFLLKSLGFEVEELDTGCCGMAGSFGYEKEHFAMSQQIAQKSLFPALEKMAKDSILIANGFSCRSQIVFGSKKRPLHLAECLAQTLRES